jgi:DNA topoisomerase-2
MSDSDKDEEKEIYEKVSQLEHILIRPDAYIGSIETYTQPLWVYDKYLKRIVN